MASYEKRGDTWRYRISLGKNPKTNKYEYISKSGFKRKSDAKHHAEMVERQIRLDEYIAPSTISFDAVVGEWLEEYSKDVKISSVRARKKAIKISQNKFGPYPIQKISEHDYDKFINGLSGEYSTNYIKSIMTSTNMVFNYAVKHGYIKKSPHINVKLKKKKETVEELENDNISNNFLEKEELLQFLKVAKHQHKPLNSFELFTTLAYTGLRIGELLALKWTDIDILNNTISVTKTYYNPNNNKRKYEILTPKTKTSIATVPVDHNIIKMLLDYKTNVQDTWKDELYNDNDFIFTDNNGYPLVVKKISQWVQSIMSETDIKKAITPHSFRHTYCALLIEAGLHIKAIQERMRHGDINTTMNVYAKITKAHKKDASQKFNELMKSVSDEIF